MIYHNIEEDTLFEVIYNFLYRDFFLQRYDRDFLNLHSTALLYP